MPRHKRTTLMTKFWVESGSRKDINLGRKGINLGKANTDNSIQSILFYRYYYTDAFSHTSSQRATSLLLSVDA